MAGPELRPLALDGPIEVIAPRFEDERGYFVETWREGWLVPAGLGVRFVQDNLSFSRRMGTVRGLHLQIGRSAQDKLVRVARGSVFDVVVDVRPESLAFGRWAAVTLSAAVGNSLFVPRGFAHGFMTLEDGCEVAYKASAPYDPANERAIRFDDPAIGIAWPDTGGEPILSPKDRGAPLLSEIRHEL